MWRPPARRGNINKQKNKKKTGRHRRPTGWTLSPETLSKYIVIVRDRAVWRRVAQRTEAKTWNEKQVILWASCAIQTLKKKKKNQIISTCFADTVCIKTEGWKWISLTQVSVGCRLSKQTWWLEENKRLISPWNSVELTDLLFELATCRLPDVNFPFCVLWTELLFS